MPRTPQKMPQPVNIFAKKSLFIFSFPTFFLSFQTPLRSHAPFSPKKIFGPLSGPISEVPRPLPYVPGAARGRQKLTLGLGDPHKGHLSPQLRVKRRSGILPLACQKRGPQAPESQNPRTKKGSKKPPPPGRVALKPHRKHSPKI